MITYLKLGAATAIAALLTFTHFYAYTIGKERVIAQLQSDRIQVLKDGKEIDAQAIAADDDALCALLGGCSVSN